MPPAAALSRPARRPYSVLLPVGFTLPPLLPGARCALAAPFHPCRSHGFPKEGETWTVAVCFLWHFPWGRPRRPLTGTVFPWSPDFPPANVAAGQRLPGRLELPVVGRAFAQVNRTALVPTVNRVMVRAC